MKKILLLLLFVSTSALLSAQNDLLDLLDEGPTTDYATASFKANRVISGQSIENTPRGVLDFKIAHRFGQFRFGFEEFWGLDNANTRIGFDYGITDRFMVGVGRSSNADKIVETFGKYKILRQSSGKKVMPVTLSYYADMGIKTSDFPATDPPRDELFSNRLSYTHQLLIGRKFSETFTLQLMPTLLHRNFVPTTEDANDIIAMGIAGRLKITKRVAINAEYYYTLPDQIVSYDYENALALGVDIETGGHVFQLHITNSGDMNYKGIISDTREDWFYQDENDKWLSGLRFGFNISRVFTIVKPKDFY